MKHTPKEVAIKEINDRIVTKEKAKELFLCWIKRASSYGVQEKHVTEFWDEVIKEVNKL